MRNESGDSFYDLTSIHKWYEGASNLQMAQNHPILTPAILFVSKIFSQANFSVIQKHSKNKILDHKFLDLIDNPNQYQTKEDFLETLMFVMIAQGVAVVAQKKILGFDDAKSMFVLDKDLIKWPENFNKRTFRSTSEKALNEFIIYDKNGENSKFRIKDLLFFYDLPNMLNKNPFTAKSRLDGLRQTLINTHDSLIAKNIILKTNGKELISGKKEGFPLSPEEKEQVENLFNNKIGLAFNRKRGVVTKSDLTYKSLHIALRDLGLDESVKVDGNIIYSALHIPKDILSLEAKKTTYNNFKESMVSYIQNEIQPSLNSACAVFNKNKGDDKIIGDYTHMPIMQFILLEKYDVVFKQATALKALLMVGIPQELALEMVDIDKRTKLGELIQNTSNNGQQENNGNSKIESERKRAIEEGIRIA